MDNSGTPTQNFASLLEHFSLSSAKRLADFYDPTIIFKDPINRANGLEELQRVFEDLFKQLQNIKFTISSISETDRTGFARWNMSYQFRRKDRSIDGVSYVEFNSKGLINHQTDYWDASFPIYGEFPLLGLAMKGVRSVVVVKHPKS